MTASASTASGTTSADVWVHFCGVLDLACEEQSFLEDQGIRSVEDFYVFGDYGYMRETPSGDAAATLFDDLDQGKVLPALKRANLVLAWKWLHRNQPWMVWTEDQQRFVQQFQKVCYRKDVLLQDKRRTKEGTPLDRNAALAWDLAMIPMEALGEIVRHVGLIVAPPLPPEETALPVSTPSPQESSLATSDGVSSETVAT